MQSIIYAMVKGVGSVRSEEDLIIMLKEASSLRDRWLHVLTDKTYLNDSEMRRAIRNYNALRGVIKALRWALAQPMAGSPLY